MIGNNSNGDFMKKIMILTIILYVLIIVNSFCNKVIPTFREVNINNSNSDISINKLECLDRDKKTVALTFDDGPSSNTLTIVDLLTKNKANATFFILGSKIDDNNLKSLKYLLQNGNEIGSHTYSHKILTRVNKSRLDSEFNTVKDILKNKLNYDLKLVRPPYGILNNYIKNKYNYSYILWNIDTLDWQSRSAVKVYNKVINHISDGDIILMHETYISSVKALEKILPELTQEGFQVTTVSNLAELKGISLEDNQVYHSFK